MRRAHAGHARAFGQNVGDGRAFMDARAPRPRACRHRHGRIHRVHPAIGGGVEPRQDPLRLDQRKQIADVRGRNLEPLHPLGADKVCVAFHHLAPRGIAGQMDVATLPEPGGKPGLGGQVKV